MSTDRKLDELATGSAVSDADLFYTLQGGVSVKQTAVDLRDYVFSGGQGDVTFSDGFVYLGAFNSQTFPVTGIGAAFGWNFSGGSGEVDIWNIFPAASPDNGSAAFTFKQLSGSGAGRTVATIYQTGRIGATQFTAGGITGQATQLELIETGLASASGAAQVRFARSESNTFDIDTQLIMSLDRVGGTGNREQLHLEVTSNKGGALEYINCVNAFAYAKTGIGTAALDVFGGIFQVKNDASLPNTALVALETDTVALSDCSRKIGIQVADIVGSVGQGADYDAGIVIGKQAGSRGYNYGIQFNYGNAASEINNAFIFGRAGATVPYGIDFSGVTFSTAAWKGNFTASGTIKGLVTTVGSLPSAATAGVGARAFVTDANATTFASTVATGGSNKVPVYSDGTNWKIG